MKEIILICPNCYGRFSFDNWFQWLLHSPFHWFGKRRTKCPYCGKKNYMKARKPVVWKTIFSTDTYIVDYDKKNKMYRVSWFEDGHFLDECCFTAKH